MKITLEFDYTHELTALLVELASKIEQPEPCAAPREPMTPAQMQEALRPAINSKSPESAIYKRFNEAPISHDTQRQQND
jgi:hypothetical protein